MYVCFTQNESVNFHLEEDEETQRRLLRLEKFAREDLETAPLIREKLCLLVSSLPAHEICTPQMQVYIVGSKIILIWLGICNRAGHRPAIVYLVIV